MANLNPEGEFSSLKERVKVAIAQQFPFVGRKHRLELVELDIKDDAAKPSSPFHIDNIQTQLDAKLADGTWAVPIQATLRLMDVATNKEIDRAKITLARLPKITRRYSYIVKGHERQHDSTFRLKARPYHLIADNGEIRAQWNLAKGKGFDLKIDPTTGLLKMKLGTSHIPLYQVLKTMGAQDAEIENAWGKEVADINRKKTNPNEILKVPKSTARKPGEITSIAQAEEYTKKLFDETRVRPDAMTAAFGKPYDRVNVENLLLSSQRLLQIARGEREEDDRQSLAAKDIASTEDYVVEAVERQTTEIRRKIMNNIDQRDTIREIISPHLYSKVIENVFTKGHLPDQTNPLEFVSSYLRTTVFNPEFGGIKGEHANLDRDQLVNPSHLGFLDPIQTPEKEAGLVLHLPIGAHKEGKELLISVWDTKEGKMVQATPGLLEHAIVAYPDQVKWVDGRPRPVADIVSTYDENRNTSLRPWKDVRYVLRSAKGVFSFGTNLMPFLQNDSAGRAMMAAKQQEQAVSLVNREAPLVQSKSESAFTFEHILGVLNSHRSPVEGVISKVSPDAISIRSSDGKAARVQLYNNYPLNGGRNLLHSESLVKAGDKVRKGQLIADSNYSKDGELALGKNIRTAYLPYHGLNFEDGVVISESASEMMTSDHLMLESATVYPGMLLDKKRWRDYSLPEKATPERMSKLGDDGIVKIGEKVIHGDVLIALLIPASFSKDALMLQNISRSLVKDFRDRSVVWNHEYPGVVTRINHVGRRIDVYVRAQEKLGVGDKVTGRHGNKGICHDDKTEALTRSGWKYFADLIHGVDEVCTRNPATGEIEYHVPDDYIEYDYDGPMYRYEGRRLDLMTTPDHQHFVRKRRDPEYRLESAKNCFGKPRLHLRTGTWLGCEIDFVEIPGRPKTSAYQAEKFSEVARYDADDFLEFFGYWVTEGCLGNDSVVNVAQRCSKNPETFDAIFSCIERLGYEPRAHEDVVLFGDVRLNAWLRQFGKAHDKFIPRSFMEASPRQLRILADALFAGDGGIYFREKDNHTRYELFTSSRRLADDYQELALKLGMSANIKPRPGEHGIEYVVRWSMKEEVWTNNDKRYDNESWVPYSGKVYCVDVRNHVIYVRRNGIPIWSGNCSKILPDHEMPHDKDGNPVHILLNPAGVPSRMNVGQVLETAASKIAEKTGKPYVVENFVPGVDYSQKVKDELKQHGLSDTEELFDPKTGKSLGQILVGKPYMLKLHHMVEKKMTARSHGGAYTATGEPPSGSGIPGGGQKMDQLATYAMLAHGAKANLREAMTWKSDADQNDVWIAVQTGRPLPDPKPSRGMNQLVDYMKGMGIHAEKKGDKYVLAPLTDKQTLSMSNGEIRFPDKALLAKGIRTLEETGGLFDPKATGGIDGKFWAHAALQQRIPNPVFEPAILSLTDMKEKEFEELVGPTGIQNGKSGFDIIAKKLKAVDVDKELKEAEARLPKLNGPALNKEYRRIRYLRALKQNNITPYDAYTNKVLPIVPPAIRKVSIGLDGKQIFDDLNGLYLSVGQINEQLRKADPSTPKSEIQKMQAHLYDAVRALRISGLDMGEGAKKRHHFGIMEKLSGTKPKESFYQDGVLSRRQDLSGRSTIVPAPELGLDEVGVPLPIAMEMYKPFVVKELHKNRGYTPLQAQKLIKEKGSAAVEALNKVVMDRPVLMKRDPVLHKYGVQAFYPRVTSGKAIGIHPLVCSGYNADFDGDQIALFVPVSTEAVDEAKKMVPSRNLFSPTNRNIMTVPGQDSLLGLFQLTAWGKAARFPRDTTPEKMVELLHAGKCNASDVITYRGRKTTVGRLALAQHLPWAMKDDQRVLFDPEFRLDKKQLSAFLSEVGKLHPTDFPNMVDKWKDLGTKNAFMQGSSISIDDFHDGKEFRDGVLKKYQREEERIRHAKLPQLEQDKKIVDLYQKAQTELKTVGQERYKKATGNGMYEWVRAGAKGNWDQFSQTVFGPILVADAKNKPVAIPITQSYGEGLPFSQYWASLHGARKGAIDRGSNTADPGAVTKDIINTVINHRVVARDCGTEKGIAIDPNDPQSDADGRFLAKPVALKSGETIPARTLLTPPLVARIRNSGIQKIVVRSPLYCQEPNGVCAMCYGHNSDGRLYPIGANVGVIAGQSLGEPVTQMTMRTFHSGGVVGTATKAVNAFDRVKDLIHVPKVLKNEATLASVDGTITSVSKNVALGGHDVVIGSTTHRLPALLEPLPHIVVGTVVKKAEPLSTGPINPHHLLEHTGNMNIVRNYITDEIGKVYSSDTKRRNIETVVRAMTNVTHIDDAPGHPSYLRGQLAPLSLIEHENREATKAGLPTIQHTPLLRPMKQVPLEVQEDWMARLNYQKLEHTFREGAAQGWTSDIHGHPIPGLAHGAEFGLRLLPGETSAPEQATIANPPVGTVKKTLKGLLSKLK